MMSTKRFPHGLRQAPVSGALLKTRPDRAASRLFVFLLASALALHAFVPVRASESYTVRRTPVQALVGPLDKATGIITPEGGAMGGLRKGDTLTFPPNSIGTTSTVTLETVSESPIQMVAELVILDLVELSAKDSDGAEMAQFSSAWTATFHFGTCDQADSCLWDSIDEASIRCLWADLGAGAWSEVESTADVIGDVLTCKSQKAGIFAISAELFETSGTSGGKAVYIPVAVR